MNEIINHHQRRRSVNNWLGKTAIPARLESNITTEHPRQLSSNQLHQLALRYQEAALNDSEAKQRYGSRNTKGSESLRGKARAIRNEVDIEIAKALGIENNTAAEGYIDLLQYRRLLRENFREIIRQHENDSCKQTHENSKPWDDLSAQDRSSGAYLELD
jgi:hypothetical protein